MNFDILDAFAKFFTSYSDDHGNVSLNVSTGINLSCEDVEIQRVVWVISHIIFGLGFIVNCIAVFTIVQCKTLRKPTYILIASLACADILCLIVEKCGLHTIQWHIPFDVFQSIAGGAMGASTHHVIGLSLFRLQIMKDPLQFGQLMTAKRTAKYIACCWAMGIFIGIGAYVLSYIHTEENLEIIIMVFLFVMDVAVPQALLLSVHIMKIRALRRSTVYQEHVTPYIHALSKMTCCIIIVNILTSLPIWVAVLLLNVLAEPQSLSVCVYYILPISLLFLTVSHSTNPVIFFFMSKPFKESKCFRRTPILRQN